MREDFETADYDPLGERARMFGTPVRRPGSGSFLGREVQMIKAGARRCVDCGRVPGTIATGPPYALRAICENCQLNRRAALQRETREAMKRRG